jgi:hypothetical protein
MQLGAQSNKDRKKAKDTLKKLYLEEFQNSNSFNVEELRHLESAVKHVNKRFTKPNKAVHRTA